MKKYVNGEYIELTAEEVAAMEAEARLAAIEQNRRPLTENEVLALLIPMQINTLEVDDNTALRMVNYYPEWATNTPYHAGFKVRHNGKLWRVVQAHTAQDGWQPGNAPSLWEQINETHTGALTDPIPYSGGMALESGKHYIEAQALYLCTRDTINPVYNPLSELVGIYVEVV